MLRLLILAPVLLCMFSAGLYSQDRYAIYGDDRPTISIDIRPAYTDYEIAAGVAERRQVPLVVWVRAKTTEAPELRAALKDAVHLEVDSWPTYNDPGVLVTDRNGREYSLRTTDIGPRSAAKIQATWQWAGAGPCPDSASRAAMESYTAQLSIGYNGRSMASLGNHTAEAPQSIYAQLSKTNGYSSMASKSLMSYNSPAIATAYLSRSEMPVTIVHEVRPAITVVPTVRLMPNYMAQSYPMTMYGAGMMNGYGSMGARYGAALPTGQYATPTGLPPGPGILGVPGARFPFDGPLRRAIRYGAGFDPGPAMGSVRSAAGGCST